MKKFRVYNKASGQMLADEVNAESKTDAIAEALQEGDAQLTENNIDYGEFAVVEIGDKDNVRDWETVATFLATFADDSKLGTGAITVEVQVGYDGDEWFIRTTDEGGGNDDCDDTAYQTKKQAIAAAHEYANTHDENEGMGDDPETYLQNKIEQAIEAGKAKDGNFALVSSQDHSRWDNDRYADQNSAELAIDDWHDTVQQNNPGTQLLWGSMDCPIVAELVDGEWIPVRDED